MKRTNQMRKAIMGTGHGNRTVRKGLLDTVASVPRNEPYPRQIRQWQRMIRATKVNAPKWLVMSPLTAALMQRAGAWVGPEGAA